MNNPRPIRPQVALETTMQDVLGNMAELAMDFGFHDMGGEFEILSIEPAPSENERELSINSSLIIEILSAEITPLSSHHTKQKLSM